MSLNLFKTLEDAVCLIEIESTDWLAYLGLGWEVLCAILQTYAVDCLVFVGKSYHLVGNGTDVETNVIFEIIDLIVPVQLQLKALVAHLTYVQGRVVKTCRRSDSTGNQKIACLVEIVVDITIQVITEETEVETDVLGICGFPLQWKIFQCTSDATGPRV